MATFAGLIRPNERKKDGTWNVKIRVTHKGVSKYIKTPFFVTKNQITRGYKIKDAKIQDLVNGKIREYRETLNKIGFMADKADVDVEHLISLLDTANNTTETVDFIKFFDSKIKEIEDEGRSSTAKAYIRVRNSILAYNQNKPLYFSNITSQYVLDYYKHLKSAGLKTNTIALNISLFRGVYREAQVFYNDDELGVVIARHGVFNKLPDIKRDKPRRVSLTREQMQAIINLPYSGIWLDDFIRDMFVLSFLCFGINARDLFFLKKSQCKDGVLEYRRTKTARGGSDADMRIRLSEPAKIILKKYSEDSEYLIYFNGYGRHVEYCRHIHNTFQRVGIEMDAKPQTGSGVYVFYTCRHTMASLARNECGIDYMTIHQMLNHAMPREFKTTDIYVHRDFAPLWEANDKLVALFDWSFYLEQKKKD